MLWLICCSSQFLLLWLCVEFVCFPSYDLTSWQVRCTVYFPHWLVWKSKCPLNQNLSTKKACVSCRLPAVPKSHGGLKSRGVFFLHYVTSQQKMFLMSFVFVLFFPPQRPRHSSGPCTRAETPRRAGNETWPTDRKLYGANLPAVREPARSKISFQQCFMLSHANNPHPSPQLLLGFNCAVGQLGFLCPRPILWILNLHPKVHICLFDVRGPQQDSELQRTDCDCDQSPCRN